MCDEFTPAERDRAKAAKGLNRREFTAIGAATVLASYATGACAITAPGADLTETDVRIATPDGSADGFFIHPATGTHPGVLVWPDIAGPREAFRLIARRLAAAGFAVLVVNQYYRSAPAPVLASFGEWRTPEGQDKLKPMIAAITPEGIMRDAGAFVAWLDSQAAVAKGRGIGTQGYCMGGPFAVRTAAAVPARVRAAASFHGAALVTDKPDSPHRLLGQSQAAFLFASGKDDDARAPTDKDTLRTAAAEAGRPAEVEVYAANHGWCVPDTPSWDAAEADRAWARLLALYAKL